MERERERLYELVKERAFEWRRVVLTSGRESNYYFDGKQVTLIPEGAYLTARMVIAKIRGCDVEAVGGLTIGADPIVGALAAVAHMEGLDLNLFIVRKNQKQHGKMKLIEGPELRAGQRVAIVDDVITTGGSVLQAIRAVREVGCKVVKVIALVDRREGGTEKIQELGIEVDPIFTVDEFVK